MRYQEGEWAFEVTEEVGHVIVQPCVFVRVCLRAWVCACMPLQVCVGVHASLFRNGFLVSHKLMPAFSLPGTYL